MEYLKEQTYDLEEKCNQKDKTLLNFKSCWSQMATAMTAEREEMAEQNKSFQKEVEKLKSDRNSATNQFAACQAELEKALQVANEFKRKIEEDEQIKQDMLNQLLSERAAKSKEIVLEQGRTKQAMAQVSDLKADMEKFRHDVEDSKSKCEEAVKTKEEYKFRMTEERLKFETTNSNLQKRVVS